MSMMLLRFAGALELALVCAEGVVPGSGAILPLGGSPLSQVGVVFGVSFVFTELVEILINAIQQAVEWLRGRSD
jgi:branched-subunit amino acid ABC-type transport system permease component